MSVLLIKNDDDDDDDDDDVGCRLICAKVCIVRMINGLTALIYRPKAQRSQKPIRVMNGKTGSSLHQNKHLPLGNIISPVVIGYIYRLSRLMLVSLGMVAQKENGKTLSHRNRKDSSSSSNISCRIKTWVRTNRCDIDRAWKVLNSHRTGHGHVVSSNQPCITAARSLATMLQTDRPKHRTLIENVDRKWGYYPTSTASWSVLVIVTVMLSLGLRIIAYIEA